MSQNVFTSTEKPKAAPYQPLYAERGIVPDQTLALKLSKDGTYELRPVLPDAELLRACLFIHQTVTKKGKKK